MNDCVPQLSVRLIHGHGISWLPEALGLIQKAAIVVGTTEYLPTKEIADAIGGTTTDDSCVILVADVAGKGDLEMLRAWTQRQTFVPVPTLVLARTSDAAEGLTAIQYGVEDILELEGLTPAFLRGQLCKAIRRFRLHDETRRVAARFRALADAMPQIIFTARTDGSMDFVNRHFQTYTGAKTESGLNLDWLRCLHAEDRDATHELWTESVRTGRAFEAEYRFRRHDGQYRWHLARAAADPGDGSGARWIGTSVDIHDLKETRDALVKSERRLRTALEGANAGTWEWDIPSDVVYWSRESFELYGAEPSQSVPTYQAWLQLVHPDDRERADATAKRVLSERLAEFRSEYRIIHPVHGVRWLLGLGKVTFDRAGVPILIVGMHLDITAEKAFEKALRESEERLRLATKAAQIGVWTWDVATNAVFWSRECHEMLGVQTPSGTLDDFTGRVHPEDLARVWQAVEKAMATRQPYRAEFRVARPDGELRWLINHGHVEYDPAGQPRKMLGVAIDITEQKRIEQALRDNEERLRATFAQAAVGVALHDLEDRCLEANAAYCELTGYPFRELQTKRLLELIHPEDRPRHDIYLQQIRAENLPSITLRARYVRKDATLVHVQKSVSLVRDAFGGPVGILLFVFDVTSQATAERALRESESRFRSTFENAAVGVAHVALDGKWIRVNQTLCDMLGYATESAMPKSFQEITHPDDLPTDLDNVSRLLGNAAQTYSLDKRYIHRHGGVIWGSLSVSLVRHDNGQADYFIAIVQDITARKRLEAELAEARTELAQRAVQLEHLVRERTARLEDTIEQLESFSYTVSHDLKAPSRAIKAYSDALIEDYQSALDEGALGYLRSISRASERMSMLTRDLLNYSRLSQQELALHPVDVEQVLVEVLELNPDLAPPKCELEVKRPLLPVQADRSLLIQCISNLLHNAVRFTAPDRTLRIIVRATAPSPGRVRVWIEDNGIGIRPEYHAKIFSIFERLENSGEGTGVGLAIVARSAQRMGGSAGVESEYGSGSRFWVELAAGQGGI